MNVPQRISRRQALWLVGGLAGGVALHGCTQPSASTAAAQTLLAGISPWPGYSGHYVAMKKDLFKAAGVNVQETFFQSASELITGFLAGKVDIASTTSGDAIEMIHKDPTIRMIYVVDYSDGSDGIIGRDINSPADLKGKTVGRENLLFENVLLRAYLEKGGLTEKDIVIKDLTAADAATAFAAKRVDAAVSYEPWMSKAAAQGGGKLIFSTKGTNLIADTIVTRQKVIETRKADLQAYIRACAEAVKLVNGKDAEAIKIAGDKLGVSAAEMEMQLAGVKVFDIEGNKTIAFNPSNPNNVMKNFELTVKVAYESKLIPEMMDINSLYDDSIVKSL
ncbi:MAG: ABC transporter substrate-binding protein [Drouetiella hepatica Uher 2000/2452]|jgi:NitT/TauT family transport system substrate-binding protein|uniref:ABC transporter substrate-binding protein n=1 Tax=Drouetiella hepatica Uher 2000/2452 TaxID=904376 RepID=A0A951QI69_9CYAN|nr:ABC transporter substrate-binding protein [Drouetiella hepatica Uher 2000/2452]